MKLILKELDNLKCTKYLEKRFDNMLYFSTKMNHDLNFGRGKFYVILPERVNPKYPNPDYYDFETGGVIYPFERDLDVTLVEQINESKDAVKTSSLEYIESNVSHCLCLEDFVSEPHYPHIKNSGRRYYLIENRIFYLIDKNLSSEEINVDFISSSHFRFICIILNIHGGLDSLNLSVGVELSNIVKEEIFKSINSFYIEIYDNESYLIWVSDIDNSFLEIVKKNLGN